MVAEIVIGYACDMETVEKHSLVSVQSEKLFKISIG